jgi:hypothetical protein
MGLFKQPKKVKDSAYYLGSSFAAYGLYIINNWSSNEERINKYGRIFSSVAKHYDSTVQTDYFSRLFLVGTMGREFKPSYTLDEVQGVIQSRKDELEKLKGLINSYNTQKNDGREILRLLFGLVNIDPDGNDSEEKQELEFWLVQCVFNTVLDAADSQRSFSERDDGPIESMVNGLVGALALSCVGEYSLRD